MGEEKEHPITATHEAAPESLSLIEEADNEDDTMSHAMSSAVGSQINRGSFPGTPNNKKMQKRGIEE